MAAGRRHLECALRGPLPHDVSEIHRFTRGDRNDVRWNGTGKTAVAELCDELGKRRRRVNRKRADQGRLCHVRRREDECASAQPGEAGHRERAELYWTQLEGFGLTMAPLER